MVTVETASAGGSSSVRVHIGGLAPNVTAQELQERFGRVAASAQCSLLHVELPASRLTPSLSKGFAYVTIVGAAAESVLEDLTKAYHKTKWRGGVLRVSRASPDYQQRLQMEWDARDALQQAQDAAVEAERLRVQPVDTAIELRTGVAFEGRKTTAFHDDDVMVEEEEMDSEGEDDGDEEEEEEKVREEEEEWTEDAIQALIAEKLAEEATDSESDTSEDEKAIEEEDVEETDAGPAASTNSTATQSTALSVEEANARRLAALDEKKRKQNDPSAKGFLGKIDVVGGASGKKITFDDDGEIAEVEDARESGDQAAELLSGERAGPKRAVVTDWLGSDEEDHGDDKPDGYGELDDEKLLRGSTGTKKILHTLEFDDVDTQEDTEDQQRFALRPEFLGETGKKLFEMQKRFGGDQRFRMDARFIEEDENEYFAHDGDDMEMLAPVVDNLESGEAFLQQFQREEDTDKLALYEQEMIRERDQALDIVAELFPDVDVDKIKYRLEALKNKDPIKEASWMGEQMRYDPRIAATTKYELTEHDTRSRRAAKDEDEKMEEDEKRLAEEKRQREEKEVLIGGDRFYSASTSLGSLFSRVRKNSEDGEVGEAALDGVFEFSKATVDAKPGNNEPETASAFKLSSLFDFSFGGDSVKTNELAMGEDLLEGGDEDEDATTPWHFTQSFNENGGTTEDPSPRLLAEDDEGEGTDKEDDAEVDQEEEEAEEVKGKRQRVRVKRSLDDFLAFGRTFFGGTTLASLTTKDAKDAWKTQWAERRKKLTLDFKRKRRDALKQKKKQQQALQRHNAKRQKTTK